MYKDNDLQRCFDWIRQGEWTWFITLKYPREKSLKHEGEREGSPKDAFRVWIDEVQSDHGAGSPISWVRAIESRKTGDTLFHVLLRDVPAGKWQRHWIWRWFQISGGGGGERPLKKGIERLFNHFFYRVHCDIECSFDGDITLCRWDEYRPII